MNLSGVILLVLAWGTILSVAFFCFRRIFTAKKIE